MAWRSWIPPQVDEFIAVQMHNQNPRLGKARPLNPLSHLIRPLVLASVLRSFFSHADPWKVLVFCLPFS
jgi:hypothetical protein